MVRDDPDRLVNEHGLLSAKVVDAHTGCSLMVFRGAQHGCYAVLYVQVGFLLLPVSQDDQAKRIGLEGAVEVIKVTVGVTLTQNRNKPANYAREAEAGCLCGDKPFAGQLGGTVKRGLNRNRGVVRCEERRWLAIHRACRRKQEK